MMVRETRSRLGTVEHICNPSHVGGTGRGLQSRLAWSKHVRPYLIYN
jgi:hypothetical protein